MDPAGPGPGPGPSRGPAATCPASARAPFAGARSVWRSSHALTRKQRPGPMSVRPHTGRIGGRRAGGDPGQGWADQWAAARGPAARVRASESCRVPEAEQGVSSWDLRPLPHVEGAADRNRTRDTNASKAVALPTRPIIPANPLLGRTRVERHLQCPARGDHRDRRTASGSGCNYSMSRKPRKSAAGGVPSECVP